MMNYFKVFILVFLLTAMSVSRSEALKCVVCNNCQEEGAEIQTITCLAPYSSSCVKSVQQRFNEHEFRIFRKCSSRMLETDFLLECDGDPDVGKHCVHYCSSDECNSAAILSSRHVLLYFLIGYSIYRLLLQ